MSPTYLYLIAVVLGGLLAWQHDTATMLHVVVALTIIPEATSAGLRSAWHHWKNRGLKLFFWLTIGLLVPAVGVYFLGIYLGMHNPLAVAGGMLATDPAAVGLALSLSKGAIYLEPLFWQLGVESVLNDAVGIAVAQVAGGLTLFQAEIAVMETLLLAVFLAIGQTLVRYFVRRRADYNPSQEVFATLVVSILFVVVGIRMEFSLILLTAVGSLFADWMEKFVPDPSQEDEEVLIHSWEVLNQFGLAVILGLVISSLPWAELRDPTILRAGFLMLLVIIVSRFGVSMIMRGVISLKTGQFGHKYGLAGAWVESLAGVPRLGVPSIVAFELLREGDKFGGSAMLATIVLSAVFIPLGVMIIQRVERKHGSRFATPMAIVGADD